MIFIMISNLTAEFIRQFHTILPNYKLSFIFSISSINKNCNLVSKTNLVINKLAAYISANAFAFCQYLFRVADIHQKCP